MTKYIKTDAIVYKVCEGISCNECSFGTNEDGMSECVLQKRIDGLPTADVVEVVRCKDCTWWKSIFSWNGKEHKVCVRESSEPPRESDDYCSYGERREE